MATPNNLRPKKRQHGEDDQEYIEPGSRPKINRSADKFRSSKRDSRSALPSSSLLSARPPPPPLKAGVSSSMLTDGPAFPGPKTPGGVLLPKPMAPTSSIPDPPLPPLKAGVSSSMLTDGPAFPGPKTPGGILLPKPMAPTSSIPDGLVPDSDNDSVQIIPGPVSATSDHESARVKTPHDPKPPVRQDKDSEGLATHPTSTARVAVSATRRMRSDTPRSETTGAGAGAGATQSISGPDFPSKAWTHDGRDFPWDSDDVAACQIYQNKYASEDAAGAARELVVFLVDLFSLSGDLSVPVGPNPPQVPSPWGPVHSLLLKMQTGSISEGLPEKKKAGEILANRFRRRLQYLKETIQC